MCFTQLLKFPNILSPKKKTQNASYLCSHGDIGYRGDASTGLWLFVLGSGLFKHLFPLTKRHNTPAEKCKQWSVKTGIHNFLWHRPIRLSVEIFCDHGHVISRSAIWTNLLNTPTVIKTHFLEIILTLRWHHFCESCQMSDVKDDSNYLIQVQILYFIKRLLQLNQLSSMYSSKWNFKY